MCPVKSTDLLLKICDHGVLLVAEFLHSQLLAANLRSPFLSLSRLDDLSQRVSKDQ
jgi:hypothetical protein